MRNSFVLWCWFGLLAACGTPQVTVQTALAIINFAPQDGATNVDPAADEGVCFNRQVDATSARVLPGIADSSGATVSGVTVANASNQGSSDPFCLAISHPKLVPGALYQIVVPQGLTASDGSTLATTISSRFRTSP